MHRTQIRQTLRKLWKSRGFSFSVILTLGLGIGATAAVFSIIYAVLLRPLPYFKSAELMSISLSTTPNDETTAYGFSPANFTDFRAQNRSLTDLAAYFAMHYTLNAHGEPKLLEGTAVSASLFDILGVRPILGRNFRPEEDSYSAQHVMILSHHVWAEEFHSDPNIVGKPVVLNGESFYVVGVMPPGLNISDEDHADLWIPLRQQVRPDRMLWRDQAFLDVVGRLLPGVTIDQARADMNRIAAQLHAQYPTVANNGSGAVVIPLQQFVNAPARKSLLLSLGIVGFVLLIANANVAILMLARVRAHMRELSVRRALGASAWQILSDVLLESVMLGVFSGAVGIFLAVSARAPLLHFFPEHNSFKFIEINSAVVAFAVGVSILAGLSFGLIPALAVLRTDIQHVLRNGGNTSTMDAHGRRLRHLLIVGEISLSIVLLFGTGVLMRSILVLQRRPLGFRTDHVLVSYVPMPRTRYQSNEDVAKFFDQVTRQLRAVPGLQAIGLVRPYPFRGCGGEAFRITGRSFAPGEYEAGCLEFIDEGYFPVFDIPLLSGRNFTEADNGQSQAVAIVNEEFVRKYWPGGDAVGKYVEIIRRPEGPLRIIGVVGNVRPEIEADFLPQIYVSYRQVAFQAMAIVTLRHDTATSLDNVVRRAVQNVDPQMPAPSTDSIESVVHDSLAAWRFALTLLGGLTTLAVVLITVGLFAVISYLVRERTKELGVRMALGASRSDVMKLVLSQGLRLALAGIALGLALTIVLARFAASVGYAIRPNDPVTFILVAAAVAAISIFAAYVPARRAAQVDPLIALREE
jgi:putative ABC transport system permease protein